tara:strand:- start:194 stop:343 length:150 start_codon:yes stop_codon:yes gene_type:complete
MKYALLKLLEKYGTPGQNANLLSSPSFRQILANEIITLINKELSKDEHR